MDKLSKKAFVNNSGQALVVVLLVMSVALAAVLSVVARSVSEISVSTYEEESLRAFSAAEAGIEELLQMASPVDTPLTPIGDATYDAGPVDSGVTDDFNYPVSLVSGEVATFWLVSHSDTNPLDLTCTGKPCYRGVQYRDICWGQVGSHGYNNPANIPAIEISLYYDPTLNAIASPSDFSGVNVKRVVYDPVQARASATNAEYASDKNCPGSTCTNRAQCSNALGKEYAFRTGSIQVNSPNPLAVPCFNTNGCQLMLKVRVLHGGATEHPIGINGMDSRLLGEQGVTMGSTGVAGESTRKVEVFRSMAEPPDIVDVALYSGAGIVKTP